MRLEGKPCPAKSLFHTQPLLLGFGSQTMQATHHSADTRRAATESQQFPPLESVTRPTVPTEQSAYYLDRRPQTLRAWACNEDGPIRPIRINGRLAWPVSELRRVLGLA
jgi:hypothetical protein